MLSAIVLAAGLSSRMGTENKLLLRFNKKTVIAIVVEALLHAGIQDIVVVTGHESEKVQYALDNLPVKLVFNPKYAEGMTTSIQAGINAVTGTGYMICLSDLVTITAEEYVFLKNEFEKKILLDEKCICLPRYKNEPGNPVIFSAIYRTAILQNQEMEGCKNIVLSNREHIFYIDMETPHVLQDFDYPQEYHKLVSGS